MILLLKSLASVQNSSMVSLLRKCLWDTIQHGVLNRQLPTESVVKCGALQNSVLRLFSESMVSMLFTHLPKPSVSEGLREMAMAFFLTCENLERMFHSSFPACTSFFLSGDKLADTNSTL